MEKIVIFGGSGFIGSELIIKLANFKNFQVDVITRNKKTIHPLKVLPNVRFHEIKTFNPGVIERYIRGSEIVINLMGILHEDKKNSFKTIHATYPKIIQNLCIRNKIKKFIHVSALKSESKASNYLKSKHIGEKSLLQKNNQLKTFILKPSIIFGTDDNFINMFFKIMKISPFMAVISPNSLFQPISVKDLVFIITALIQNNSFKSRTFELGGPKIYSFLDILKTIIKIKKLRCILFSLPRVFESLFVALLELSPRKIITRDNLKSLQVDNVCEINHSYEFISELNELETHINKL